ncbi:MAG: EamA family transporter [Beduini sp.]|uniref:EamA family transporter n=1 Tax=Beduini sp. TaxID=1922300 RepID=UPI0039A29CCE
MNIYHLILIVSVIVASISQIFLKKSTYHHHDSLIKEYLNPYVIFGYSLMIISTVLTIFAFSGLHYKEGPIIESIGYFIVMILSYFFLNEKITKRKLLGNIIIVMGIILFYL